VMCTNQPFSNWKKIHSNVEIGSMIAKESCRNFSSGTYVGLRDANSDKHHPSRTHIP